MLLAIMRKGKHYVNLDLFRCIRIRSFGGSPEIAFCYTDRDEDVFGVSSDRLAEIEGILDSLKSCNSQRTRWLQERGG